MFDPLGSLTDFFENIANTFGTWYTAAVKELINFLMMAALPTEENVKTDFFRLNFGGSVGLALYLVTAMAVLTLLVFLLNPRRDHSLRISRFIGSIIGLFAYAILFFRVYVYIDDISKGLMQFAINFITSTKDGKAADINNLLAVSSPSGIGSVVVLGIFSVIFCWFAAAMAFGMKMVVLVVLIVYPVLIVLRPLGNIAVVAFNAANSFLIVAVISPIIMVWAVALPMVVRNIIPGANAIGLTAIVTLVCSAGALLAPTVLLVVFFRLSSQVFGRLDVQGNVAITSMPPQSYDEAMHDIQEKRNTPVRDAVGSFAGAAVGSMFEEGGMKSLISSIPDTLVHAGAVAASTQFGPMAGVAVEGAYGVVKTKIVDSREAAAAKRASEFVPPPVRSEPSE